MTDDRTTPTGDDRQGPRPDEGAGDPSPDDVLASLAEDLASDGGVAEALQELEGVDVPGAGDDPPPTLEERAAADDRSPLELFAAAEAAEARAVAAEARAEEYLDALQRRQAEFDNFRRRNQKVATEQRTAGAGDLATALLDVVDDLDGAAAAAAEDDGALAAGIVKLREKLLGVLAARGVDRIDDVDVAFDPSRHEAVQSVPRGEGDPDGETVQAVFRAGYVMGGRVLRPAMVVVRQ